MGMSEPESLTPYGRERIRREHLEAAIRMMLAYVEDVRFTYPSLHADGYSLVPVAALSKLQEAMRD